MNTSRSTRTITPDAAGDSWHDWRWQLRNSVDCLADFDRVLDLTDTERQALSQSDGRLPARLTPYYLNLLDPVNTDDPLRRMVVPQPLEQIVGEGEYADPLGEDTRSPVPGLVHRYPDRVLLLANGECPVYCRYCTRSRLVGDNADAMRPNRERWQLAIDYIAAHPEVHDVLISGGEPLILGDDKLSWLLDRLHEIPHLDLIRIGTKVPFSLPMRITPDLCKVLRSVHPLYMSLHVNHPRELTPDACRACEMLADAGVVLGAQTVLLRGINDDTDTLKTLFRALLRVRVRPYYLLQCDPIHGSAHFRTPVSTGLQILRELRGEISGYGIPHFIVDIPGGAGKVPLSPDYVSGRDGDDILLRDPWGKDGFRYHDPV